ncbi:MAG: radical SAM protein, partial [Mariprofundaceae bacterium]
MHAERIFAHIHRHNQDTLEALPDLPRRLRDHLAAHTRALTVSTTAERTARDGTRKLLLAMPDGREIETVLIPGPNRLTQCISTQAGCALGCAFCLTATAGLARHLHAAEMIAQVRHGRRIGPVRNLVLMGMGEPLHNYDEVARFVRLVTDPKGMAFSPNRVTLSTAGLVPGI